MRAQEIKVVKTEVLRNNGVHEWGRTTYSNGLVVEWTENLKARKEAVSQLQKTQPR